MPSKSKLAMLTQVTDTKWFGTCTTCHVLVDLDAEKAHAWWHDQAQEHEVRVPGHSYDTRPIRIGRHAV